MASRSGVLVVLALLAPATARADQEVALTPVPVRIQLPDSWKAQLDDKGRLNIYDDEGYYMLVAIMDDIGCDFWVQHLRDDEAATPSDAEVPYGWTAMEYDDDDSGARMGSACRGLSYQGTGYIAVVITELVMVPAIAERVSNAIDTLLGVEAAVWTDPAEADTVATNVDESGSGDTSSYTAENLRSSGGVTIDYGQQPGRMLGWFQLDAGRSVRDVDDQSLDPGRYPEARVHVGAALGMVVSPRPWLFRAAMTASPNWRVMMGGEEAEGATPEGRFGGQRYELAFEGGAAIPFGKNRLGVTAGWTGLWGPLTLSSSISASLVFAHLPDAAGDNAFYLRVTPVQLLNSNERPIMSPLAVEAQLGLGMLMLGTEVQWIAPPEPGDDAIEGGGWSASARIGYNFVSRW